MNKDNLAGFGIGLATGVAVGGILALLFAPKSGRETRDFIKEKADEVIQPIRDKINERKLDRIKP